ncbi:MAG: DsbA family oxidoreductase [Chitinophagaceae bacterium]|nr:DsbA family oxidoreductase [Chitinophagaceae bacterium]
MKVDIWSDVRCPFCYIGKRKFEKALQHFENKDQVEVEWHSFELDPYLKTDTNITNYEHLAAAKGITPEEAKEMSEHVISYGVGTGIDFHFEKVVVANSFKAHKVIQLAQLEKKGTEAEELLFKAYFTEGKNIDDDNVLSEIGKALQLDVKEFERIIRSNDSEIDYAVIRDEQDAGKLKIQGVPFFVFNDKYAVSGAQQPSVFAQVLDRSWKEFSERQKPNPQIIEEGKSCSTDGNCD